MKAKNIKSDDKPYFPCTSIKIVQVEVHVGGDKVCTKYIVRPISFHTPVPSSQMLVYHSIRLSPLR